MQWDKGALALIRHHNPNLDAAGEFARLLDAGIIRETMTWDEAQARLLAHFSGETVEESPRQASQATPPKPQNGNGNGKAEGMWRHFNGADIRFEVAPITDATDIDTLLSNIARLLELTEKAHWLVEKDAKEAASQPLETGSQFTVPVTEISFSKKEIPGKGKLLFMEMKLGEGRINGYPVPKSFDTRLEDQIQIVTDSLGLDPRNGEEYQGTWELTFSLGNKKAEVYSNPAKPGETFRREYTALWDFYWNVESITSI